MTVRKVESVANQEFWDELRKTTQARIGLGRAGDGLPTRRVLELAAAHAQARDAVHAALDVAALTAEVAELGLGTPVHVRSRAADRSEYLRRPDLGRLPETDLAQALSPAGADIAVVLADGLSPRAVHAHGAAVLAALKDALAQEYRFAPPVVATQARVALGDHIGQALGVETVLVLIGERPGLSVSDSLGIYLTHRPRPGCADSQRNCVSNIHPPEGLGYAAAARVTADLVAGARRLGRSGVELKDTSDRAAVDPGSPGSPRHPRRRAASNSVGGTSEGVVRLGQ
ncbi:ethanolamine ammonia-lyase subunit EutC [Nocardia blacklockiae]|uniref:ethanolamine ammonia-lyase subunit EutC n=1 Tax=Nocardia blacklockiae TaxID=480036 RepID=UPI0018962D5A|nr:ethanolamine ammonia-lyase subunit EutC [Nocardia blacklockiae]MBF6175104.1 ethanolamine ammonia-lyase subunit EutC [Nocardia blacklockiae]